jgi:ribosomal protein S18 acetylase RimI-like enzyme
MIRAARLEDVPEISRIHVETWRSAYAGIMPAEYLAKLSVEARTKGWTQAWERSPRDLLVAETGGNVVGWSFSALAREGDDAVLGEVFALYVLPEWQGRGHGAALMAAIEEDFRRRRVTVSVLRVLEANQPARGFYARRGYATDGPAKAEVFGELALPVLRYRKIL